MGLLSLRLQQILIKPRKIAAVHWRQSEGGLLSLVNQIWPPTLTIWYFSNWNDCCRCSSERMQQSWQQGLEKLSWRGCERSTLCKHNFVFVFVFVKLSSFLFYTFFVFPTWRWETCMDIASPLWRLAPLCTACHRWEDFIEGFANISQYISYRSMACHRRYLLKIFIFCWYNVYLI